MRLGPNLEDTVPDGYFWCQMFTGRHLSFDYNFGDCVLVVEGIRDGKRLDRFAKWIRLDKSKKIFFIPVELQSIVNKYEWVNLEVIGDKVIEVHFRYNDDFACHNSNEIIPVWKDQFYSSDCGDRLGFILK